MAYQLKAARHALAEHKILTHFITLEEGVPYDAIFDPRFWAHIAAKIRRGDWVIVTNDSVSFEALVKVRDVGPLFVVVAEIWKKEFADAVVAPEATFQITTQYRGPHDKHCVIRTAPGKAKEVILKGFETAESAAKAAAEHMLVIGAKAAA